MLKYSRNVHCAIYVLLILAFIFLVRMWPETSGGKFFKTEGIRSMKIKIETFQRYNFLNILLRLVNNTSTNEHISSTKEEDYKKKQA